MCHMSPLLTSVTKQVQNRVHDLSIGAFFIIWRDASVWIGPFFSRDPVICLKHVSRHYGRPPKRQRNVWCETEMTPWGETICLIVTQYLFVFNRFQI